MAVTPPVTDEDFKTRFDRDFLYGAGKDKVRDVDINRALVEADALFNADLWVTTEERDNAYLYLSAHILALNLQASGGLQAKPSGAGAKNRGGGVTQNKSVGGVSIGFAVPEFVTSSPTLSQMLRTDYGQRYIQLLAPRITGNVNIARGTGLEPV